MSKHLLVAASDLHTEFYDQLEDLQPLADLFQPAKFLVLAGDLGVDQNISKLLYFIRKVKDKYDHILLVSGNHDWWNPKILEQRSCLEVVANSFSKVHLLNRNTIELDNFKFSGCTAWYALDPVCAMNDRHRIYDAVNFTKKEASLDRAFLESLNRGSTDVLITHVPLSERGMNPILAANNPYLNKFYHHALDDLVTNISPSLAISGHTHHRINFVNEGVRYISAPVGYPQEIKFDYQPFIVPMP